MKKYIAIVLILIFSICYAGTFKWQIKIENSDGTFFNSTDSAGASARLYHSDAAGATGTLSQTMTEISNGIWYADVDTDSAGWYEVKTYTDADPSWTSVSGFDPVWIGTKDYLPLDGSRSMTDNLGLGGNKLDSVSGLSFSDSTALIGGNISSIYYYNLLDKSADEDIAGLWDFASNKLSIDDTVVTATANQINLLSSFDNDETILTTYGGSENSKRSVSSDADLDYTDMGYIELDSSGDSLDIILPDLDNVGAGGQIILLAYDYDNDIDIHVDNVSDEAIILMTASSTETGGKSITLEKEAAVVIMIASGVSTGGGKTWIITGGYAVTIN